MEFYERLGFTQARTGDTWSHPYGVLTDGRVHVGLHQCRLDSPALTFVRPDIARHAAALQQLGIEPSVVKIGGEVFHEIGFRDPAGQPVRLLEARTFSPSDRDELETSRCGAFAALSLPAPQLEPIARFWEALGFTAGEEESQPYQHLPLTRADIDLALHHPRLSGEPLLVFRDAAMTERIARLREMAQCPLEPPPRGLDPRGNALLRAPEGTGLLLLQDGPHKLSA